MNEQLFQQLAALAQQYMQSQDPNLGMQLLQSVIQSQDPQLITMASDAVAAGILQSGGATPADASGMPMGGGAPQGGAPMGQNGMQIPQYAKGGKLSAVSKLLNKKKQTEIEKGKSPKPNHLMSK